MAQQTRGFDARHLQLVALSPDTPALAREMADKYGIEFPLLSDPDLVLAKQYAGVSTDGFPLPWIYILRSDGSVLFKKIGEARHDRVSVAKIFALVDEMNNSKGMPAARSYAHPAALRAALGVGGHRLVDDKSFATALEITGSYSLGRFVSLGLSVGGLALPEQEAHMAAIARAQLPYWGGVGELYLQFPLGMTRRLGGDAADKNGWYHGIALGNEFEVSPGRLVLMEFALNTSVFDGEGGEEYASSTRLLFSLGYGWHF